MATNPAEPSQDSLQTTLAAMQPRPQVDPRSLRGVAANALQGFAMGVAATPQGAGASQGLGGAVGGLAAIGEGSARRQAARSAADADRRKLLDTVATKTLEERIKQPFELAKENRADQSWRSKKDYEFGQQLDLLKKGTKLRAQIQGVPDDVADRARDQAAANVQSLGLSPASPGYNEIYLQEFGKIVDGYHRTRQEAFPKPKAGAAAPASKPVTADEFISGGGF